jgi:hypothetical protein
MKIQFVIPLSLFILVSGWFIGTKTWESHTSATEIEKSLCSKTFNKDDKNCQVIVLEPETSYNFNEIKQVIPAVVNDVVNEKTKQDQTSNNINNNSQETSSIKVRKNKRTYTKRGRRSKAKRNFTRRRRNSIHGSRTWQRTDRFKDPKAMGDSNL